MGACIQWAILKYTQKNVHDAQKNVYGIQETFKQYIVLSGRDPGFVINELCFEVRFRYLKNLENWTLLKK